MKKTLLLLLIVIFISELANAQFVKSKSIDAKIGYGMTMPYYSMSDIGDDGLFLQGEYVLTVASWFELRPYAGFLLTSSNGKDLNDNLTTEKAETTALLLGGKARLRVPVRWIAPYFEVGIGGSIGKFETFTYYSTIDKSGLVFHIPISFGLELGRNNDVELGFSYYQQENVEQFAGAMSLGISFPLKSKK